MTYCKNTTLWTQLEHGLHSSILSTVRQIEQNVPWDDFLPNQNHCHSNQSNAGVKFKCHSLTLSVSSRILLCSFHYHISCSRHNELHCSVPLNVNKIDYIVALTFQLWCHNCDLWREKKSFWNGLNKTSGTPNPHESLSWEEHKRRYLAKCSNSFYIPIQWIQTRSTGWWLKASKLLLCSNLVLWV